LSDRPDDELGVLAGNLAEVVVAADPIPLDVLHALRSSFNRRTPDADLAELVYDSALDEDPGVRHGGTSRQLSFAGPRITVEMEVVTERTRLVGQILPPMAGRVEIRSSGGSYLLEVDDLGRFATDYIPKGPVSFRCLTDDSKQAVEAVTDWVVL
jgi:hypothetical protein